MPGMHYALHVKRNPTVMTPELAGIRNKGLVEIECIGRESVGWIRLWHALEAVAGAIESRDRPEC